MPLWIVSSPGSQPQSKQFSAILNSVSQSESVQILTQMAEILLNNLLTESHKPNTWYMTLPRINWRLL